MGEEERENRREREKRRGSRGRMPVEQGCRYSALLELQYFDLVRMLVINPMHNMMLGTGKRMIQDQAFRH